MPIYEYACDACGHELEALQKISEPRLKKCPDCGRPKLRRLISPPVFRLKGAGWYETDFKSDKEGKRNLADRVEKEESKVEAKSDAKPEAKSDTKAESKPETKAEPKSDSTSDSTNRTSVSANKPPAKRATRASAHLRRKKKR